MLRMIRNEDVSVRHRLRAKRLEVETPVAMFEFDITQNGLVRGGTFAHSGFDLRNLTSDDAGAAETYALEWLSEARQNNPRI